MNTADLLVDRLMDWGVEVIFGLPGDGINGIMEALRTRQDKIRFVQVRHEETAAFMACGYAKFTGRLGVSWLLQVQAGYIFSTDFMTPSSTISQCSRLPACNSTT
jgi:thiamine pyrophosphate-dependent acetolactate synthase large subunit-like protein